jgi:type IV pilus assembly protein PilC
MSTFAFRAVDVAGVPTRGEVEADTKGQVAEQLREKGLIVLDVSEEKEALKLESFLDRFRGIRMREMAVFSRQFATLIGSGMPMLRSLYTLEDQTEDERLSEAIRQLRQDVEAGSSLADAMERRPEVFDRLFRSMVRSGEGSGRLEESLDRTAGYLEKMDALRRQIRSAMMYPAFVFVLAMIIMLVVVAFIVPVFAGVFEDLASEDGASAELPLPTRINVALSEFVTGYWFVWIPALIGSIVGFFQWKKTDSGRKQWDSFKLKIPFHIGDVVHKVALARWSRTFSGTVASGVPILQSIQITGETSGNVGIEEAMDDVYASVKSGGSISNPIEKRPDLFPVMVTHMVAVGEETGQLEHMLTKVADFYEAEVDAKVKALTSLLEPVMIVFVGGIVGFIVISMYLPIFSLYDKIK